MPTTKHFTEEKTENFVFYIASDFIDKLQEAMDTYSISQKELAKRLDVSQGWVSQIFHNPGNLTLETIVKCARSVGIKVALIAYDDGDKENANGPIIADVFYKCWESCGKPSDMFDFDEPLTATKTTGNVLDLELIESVDIEFFAATKTMKMATQSLRAIEAVHTKPIVINAIEEDAWPSRRDSCLT